MAIDSRLLDPLCPPNIEEDFNRTLALIDEGGGGGGGGALNVNCVYSDTYYLDKTFAEIRTAFLAGTTVIITLNESFDDPDYGNTTVRTFSVIGIEEYTPTGALEDPNSSYYNVGTVGLGTFTAATLDGYPMLAE